MKKDWREVGDVEPFDLSLVTNGINADDDLEQAIGCRNAPKRGENFSVGGADSLQQAAPGEVNVDLIGRAFELFGKVFDGGLHEHCIRQTTLTRFPRRFHRRLLERFHVRVDADVELVRICAGRDRYKATVAGPDVDHHSFAGMER